MRFGSRGGRWTRKAAALARFGARGGGDEVVTPASIRPRSPLPPPAPPREKGSGPAETRASPVTLMPSQQGALEGSPFGQWNARGPIRSTVKALGRVIYLANIPLRLQLPPRPNDLRELCFRTYPRAGKLEIKRILQLVYGLDVEKVHTINMDAKKKYNPRKKYFYRTASYKKCYVYLKRPITLSKNLFPLNLFYGDPEKKDDKAASDSAATATAVAAG